MNTKIKSLTKSKKGFTLVELIVVIVIIAILAAALVTSLVGYINKARETTALVEANNVYVATQAYISENLGQKAIIGTDKETHTGVPNDTVLTAINTYLGSDVVLTDANSAKGKVTSITYDAEGTITAFNYTATNGNLVAFTTAGGWVKG